MKDNCLMCDYCSGPMPQYAPNTLFCCFDCQMHAQGRVENPEAFDAGLCDECCEEPRRQCVGHLGIYCGERCKLDRKNRVRRHNRICVRCEERRVPPGAQKLCTECATSPELKKERIDAWRAKPESQILIANAPSSSKAYGRARAAAHVKKMGKPYINAQRRARRAKVKADGVKDDYNSDPVYHAFLKYGNMMKKQSERYQKLGEAREHFFTKNGWDDSWCGFNSPKEMFDMMWSTEHNREYMEAQGCTHRFTIERDELGFPVDYYYEDGEPRINPNAICRYHLHHIREKQEWFDEMDAATKAGDEETFKRLFNEANHPDNLVYITEHEHFKIHGKGYDNEPSNQSTISGEMNNE